MRAHALVALLICCALPLSAPAATVIVPDHQPTIQAGIDAAVNGDTVLVRDGTWTGTGNWDLDFGGRAITVASENGPESCILDGGATGYHRLFIFQSGEGTDSVLQGFTIRNGGGFDNPGIYYGGGILCTNGSSPLIVGNIITDCDMFIGAGICCLDSSPTIIDNLIQYNFGEDLGGGLFCDGGSPLIAGNTFYRNIGMCGAGISCRPDLGAQSNPHIVNNLFQQNIQVYPTAGVFWGSAIHCEGDVTALVENCSFVLNTSDAMGCAVQTEDGADITISNSIFRDNDCDLSNGYSGFPPEVTHSCVEDGWPGAGNITSDPLFTTGPGGDNYLSQTSAGQVAESPCIDSGNLPATDICWTVGTETTCLDERNTHTDQQPDTGQVDMGYHYPNVSTVAAAFTCDPASGTLPFTASMAAVLTNRNPVRTRRLDGRIDVTLGNGSTVSNWRGGYTNLGGGESYSATWNQSLPGTAALLGDNRFELRVVDVTPAPWNQPPFPPAGDTDFDACTVTGLAP
jgi:hypothetical protein